MTGILSDTKKIVWNIYKGNVGTTLNYRGSYDR